MNIGDIMKRTGALDSISRELGVRSQYRRGPAPGGHGGRINRLRKTDGGNVLYTVSGNIRAPSEPGNELLGQIIGSKDASRIVVSQASRTTAIDPALIKKMLPLLAMAGTGYIAIRKCGVSTGSGFQGSGLGGMLGRVLGGGQAQNGTRRSCFTDRPRRGRSGLQATFCSFVNIV